MQEIERKYLPTSLPDHLESFPHREIVQGYLSRSPAIRVRASRGHYRLTVKGGGMMSRTEDTFDLGSKEAFEHLLGKCDGRVIHKTRYLLPVEGYPQLTGELDVFSGELEGLVVLEVEFPDEQMADAFQPPAWFGEDVSFDGRYHNSYLSACEEVPPCPLGKLR